MNAAVALAALAVIALITEWQDQARGQQLRNESSHLGGSMRLGAQDVLLQAGSLARELYGREVIAERRRYIEILA